MEVHQHTHHASGETHAAHGKKNWKSYFWEFLMLFLAVFCGFLAENQREHYVEKIRAKQYARSLINDLKKDTAMIGRIIRQANRGMHRIDTLAGNLNNKEIKQIRNIDLMIAFIPMYRPYTWNRTTLEQIKNSGSIRYFTNDSIISKINAYDAFTRHMDEDYKGDEERLNSCTEIRNRVVDQNYPLKFREALETNRDSLLKTDYFREMITSGPQLLTGNIYDIKVYANELLSLREGLSTRSQLELPDLKNDAKVLISLLKKEYHLE